MMKLAVGRLGSTTYLGIYDLPVVGKLDMRMTLAEILSGRGGQVSSPLASSQVIFELSSLSDVIAIITIITIALNSVHPEGVNPFPLSGIIGLAFSAVYFKTKHWAMNNVFGIAFSIQVSFLDRECDLASSP
jgi:hypothetical protein